MTTAVAAPRRGDIRSTEHSLNRAFQRYAVWVRVLVVVPCAGIGIMVTPEPYLPAAAAVGALALVWCGLSLLWLRRRPPAPVIAAAATLVVLVAGLTQDWTGPDSFNGWAFAIASITAIGIQYELPSRPWLALLVSVTAAVAYTAGTVLSSEKPDLLLGVRLLAETGLSRLAYVLIRARARAADRSIARAAEQRRAASVAAARRAAEREYLATLHDTASATLLMVSLGVAGTNERTRAWLPERAGKDVAILTALTSAPAERGPAALGSPGAEVDLVALLADAVEHPALSVERDLPAALPVPATPGLAIAHGVAEAISNVARHASVGTATLALTRGDGGGVVIELSDKGRGFDPARVPEHRRGLAGSIVDRMAAAGGTAEIESAPGEGTTVRWSWHG
ncbi:ATP-binding protein [Saccharomonospora sp. NPDC006951]